MESASPAPAPSPSGSSKTSPTKPSTPGYGNRGGGGDADSKRDGTPAREKKKVKMEAPVVQPGECFTGVRICGERCVG
jgi:hypothetical protein